MSVSNAIQTNNHVLQIQNGHIVFISQVFTFNYLASPELESGGFNLQHFKWYHFKCNLYSGGNLHVRN